MRKRGRMVTLGKRTANLREGEREESIANGPNNSLNFERLKSLFEFLEKLSILARSEIELSLFSRELPMLKDG